MAENNKIPAIRFAGFTDDWEQRKLGTIGTTFTGLSGKTSNDFGHGSASFVTYMNVFSNPIADLTKVEPIEIDNKQRQIQYGDVFFTTSSETSEEVGMSSIWLGNTENTYLNSFCFGFRPFVKYDPYYFAYMLRSDVIRKPMVLLAQGISRYNISKNKVMDISTSMPDIKEQEKIGKMMIDIDNLITLHQRKCDKLINVKKSLLEKMFPADGEDTPRIRFKGFTDAWEQRKYVQIFDYERPDKYIVINDKYDNANLTPVLTANKGFILGYTNETNTYDRPCIIFDDFTLDSKYVDFKFMVKSSAMKILTVKNGYDLYFTYNRLNSDKIENLGHARHFISVVQPTETLVPMLNEQEKIGELLGKVEALITLHQRKCEKLKNIKKSLLEKMFV